jgi:hypothetical protein
MSSSLERYEERYKKHTKNHKVTDSIVVDSIVIFNENIVYYILSNEYLEKDICNLLLRWKTDKVKLSVIDVFESEMGEFANIEGIVIPVECLSLSNGEEL